MTHRTRDEIETGLPDVLSSPGDQGEIKLIVRRPGKAQREIMEQAELDLDRGLVGDDWINRAGVKSDVPSPFAQVTVMNSRYTNLIAGDAPADWALAGDQLYVDLDISVDNLPTGSRLQVGEAVLEISAEPHTGCVQFSGRFGSEALKATNDERGRRLRLRGLNAAIVEPGVVQRGDIARKV